MTTITRTRSFIEAQFPVSKVSKESYKERKANYSQTLTGLGKWWGRKPLVLVRAALLGLLMPTSDDPHHDRDIFLKIMTMDEEGMWRRQKTNIPYKEVYELLTEKERERYFRPVEPGKRPYLKRGTREEKAQMRQEVQRLAFSRLSYDEKLGYCYRPEEIEGPSEEAWEEINAHLGTEAGTLPELFRELGRRQFGRVPRVGDAFAGGGSVPFEAARMGCDVYGSDLNPVAALLTWASLAIVGGGKQTIERVRRAQQAMYQAVDRQFTEWGIEHNECGWRADAYLYCVETRCPECGVMVPMAPTWIIGKATRTIARLEMDESGKRFDIHVEEGVSKKALKSADDFVTVTNNGLSCPACGKSTPIQMIRGDKRAGNGKDYGLRLWENEDVAPRPNDVFQERLYCVRWVETYTDKKGNEQARRHFRSVTSSDLEREEKVLRLLQEHFASWQKKGFIPNRPIEPGDETTRVLRERGWTHWHHLFNPRQLLLVGSLLEKAYEHTRDRKTRIGCLLTVGKVADYNSRLSRYRNSVGNEARTENTFYNQALNTLYNYGTRPVLRIEDLVNADLPAAQVHGDFVVEPADARADLMVSDVWLTDPPYADAVNYHELGDFFLAWYRGSIKSMFPEWYTDGRHALAIRGNENDFRQTMVEAYQNLSEHMTDSGAQVVMFTHQDTSVWADLALILWAAGLRVTAAWTIATETDTVLKEGNYVQGTVLLVLRKRSSDQTAFEDEITYLIEEEVQAQLDSMQALDADEEEPSFGDTDYQLAAYAAALRVLTQYSGVQGWDIERELARPRGEGGPSPIERAIDQAVKIAADHLVPQGFDTFIWKTLTPAERLYLKGLELESHEEFRTGAYQELARGFGVRDYTALFASSRANKSRFKSASEFGTKMLGGEGFEGSPVRQALMAVREARRSDDAQVGRAWLRNEVPAYWEQRKKLIAILRYFGRMEHASEHWREDAQAARLVAAAVENDHM